MDKTALLERARNRYWGRGFEVEVYDDNFVARRGEEKVEFSFHRNQVRSRSLEVINMLGDLANYNGPIRLHGPSARRGKNSAKPSNEKYFHFTLRS